MIKAKGSTQVKGLKVEGGQAFDLEVRPNVHYDPAAGEVTLDGFALGFDDMRVEAGGHIKGLHVGWPAFDKLRVETTNFDVGRLAKMLPPLARALPEGAEVDGVLRGFVLAETRHWEFGRGEKTGWIKVLGVDPQFQSLGIGRKLGSTLMDHFGRVDVRKVRTLVDWYEGGLISYFKSLGFDILNMIPLEKELES